MIKLQTEDVILTLLPMGASIYKLETKNNQGLFKNIVLNHKNPDDYANNNPEYYGNTCGRVAGRIKDATFTIDDTTYNLTKNCNNKHTHHGGIDALNSVVWDYEITEDDETHVCTFTYSSKDMDNGFPGNVDFMIEYVLHENTLCVNYFAKSDKNTYINLTNHTYFNLSDNHEHIYKHMLELDSSHYVSLDEENMPVDIVSCEDSIFDFSTPNNFYALKNIENNALKVQKGYDHTFLLDKLKDFSLRLSSKDGGRSVTIKASYPAVVIYTNNFAKNDNVHTGIAIEPQYAPNAMNDDRFFIPITGPKRYYTETIKYIFNE